MVSPDPPTRLYDALCELDVLAADVRKDPSGKTWLPDDLRALVESNARCREVLAEWIDEELEFFDSVKLRPDALFTDRVVKATEPEQIAGAGLEPGRRGLVLAAAYALAAGLAILILRSVIVETSLLGMLAERLRGIIGG